MTFKSRSSELRYLIQVEISATKRPLSTDELANTPALKRVQATQAEVSRMVHMMMQAGSPSRIARVLVDGPSRLRRRYAYFDPKVLTIEGAEHVGVIPACKYKHNKKKVPVVNSVNPSDTEVMFRALPEGLDELLEKGVEVGGGEVTPAPPASAKEASAPTAMPTVEVPITQTPPTWMDVTHVGPYTYVHAVWRIQNGNI